MLPLITMIFDSPGIHSFQQFYSARELMTSPQNPKSNPEVKVLRALADDSQPETVLSSCP